MDAAEPTTRTRELMSLAADPQRWAILRLLEGGERSVSGLVAELDIAQPAVSHHLGRLRRAGLVEVERQGRSRRYRWAGPGADPPAGELLDLLRRWFRNGPAPRVATARRPSGHPAPLDVHLL